MIASIILYSICGITITVFVCAGVVSKRRFNKKFDYLCHHDIDLRSETEGLCEELQRIDELKDNLYRILYNTEKLDIPTPESLDINDDVESSLNKVSQFFEKHSEILAGSEQLILSILPTSQLGASLHAMKDCLPPNLCDAILGDSIASIHNSISSLPEEGLQRFLHGMQHLSHAQLHSMQQAFAHHNILSAISTPFKAGALETLGIHDAAHDLAHSLSDISENITSSLGACPSVEDLSNSTDFDVTGHIPVITLAVSAFREFQLLSEDKTTYLSSLKNIALDAAGASIGGVVGAKGGAIAGGCFGGPMGAVIGGVIGGFLGAFGGRKISNEVKMQPLRNSISDYETNYNCMKAETKQQSRDTLYRIKSYVDNKRTEFKAAPLMQNIPVLDSSSVVSQIAFALYQCVLSEVVEMKASIVQLRKSIWYSAKKYDVLLDEYSNQAASIERQLPSISEIQRDPKVVIDTLMALQMPNRQTAKVLNSKIEECRIELKIANDKNDASILMWSYMVNNLYQKTLNDVTEFSNQQMRTLNTLFTNWKNKMEALAQKIETEKAKLGIK